MDIKSTAYFRNRVWNWNCCECMCNLIKMTWALSQLLKWWGPSGYFSSVQSLSHVQFFAIPWIAARQASLSITSSQSLLKLKSIESVMPSNHLILCHPLLLPPSIFPSIGVFSSESVLHSRWPNYWSFSFNIKPSNEYSRLSSLRIDWFDLLEVQGFSRVFSSTTSQKHRFFCAQPTLWSKSCMDVSIHTWLLEKP